MKDIFIDNNVASKFCNPMDPEYLKLVNWLLKDSLAHLVVSKKLIREYMASNKGATSGTSITVLISRLSIEGRLVNIGNEEIREFKRIHFRKKVESKLTCNTEDRDHIPVVLLSKRKYALAYDQNFLTDLVNFPGFNVTAASRPEKLPYSK